MSKLGRNRQFGLSLSKLMFVCAIIGLVALLGMKLAPEYIEYGKIKTNAKAVAEEATSKPNVTVAEVRTAFARRAEIDHIKGFNAADLDVTKNGNEVEVSFAYQRVVPLFANISILIDFTGTTAK